MKYNIKQKQIINAAIEVIKEKGIEEATVREIAQKAGVTTGAIYYHYKNKDELFYDVINYSIHFSHKICFMDESILKNKDELLSEIKKEITLRLSKTGEQKLYVHLLSDIISKDGILKEKYKENYKTIIDNVADLYYFAFGVENEELKTIIATILIAALDGIAIQTSLGVLPEDQEKFAQVFNRFFAESIPAFLEKHLD